MEPYDTSDAVDADYREQSREFLQRARIYLANGDLHQASEKAGAPLRGWQKP